MGKCPRWIVLLSLLALVGCAARKAPSIAPIAFAQPRRMSNAPLPGDLTREERMALLLDSLDKRILGRRASLEEVKRVVTEIAPLVAEAAKQPGVQSALAQMASDDAVTIEETRKRWIALQEADLLLEAGGDPDAISSAQAVGVAQWLAGTGRGVGLPVDLAASTRLTGQIETLNWKIAWCHYLARPDADPQAPGAPSWTPAQAAAQLPALRAQREPLLALRRAVDARYDPRPAIFAQTRYLLHLYRRFPSVDWLFQAYHGGEAGVTRTLKLYLGKAWPGSVTAAIRTGNQGKWLRFEDVYLATTPLSHTAAFDYLYGRGDDHRHYWWKIRVAAAALARYRRDPAECEAHWKTLFPGRPMDAVWYPDAEAEMLPDLPAVEAALVAKRLVPVRSGAGLTVRADPYDAAHATQYAALRPETLGALELICKTYREQGGTGTLPVGDLTLTPAGLLAAQTRWKALEARLPKPAYPPRLWPPKPKTRPGGGPPADFDFHTVGVACDLLPPNDPHSRKILDYALDYWEERGVIATQPAKDRGEHRIHFVANPRFLDALTVIGNTAKRN